MCNPGTFTGCTGCPKAQCLFHRFGKNSFRYLLHLVNLTGMLWVIMVIKNWRPMEGSTRNESPLRDKLIFKNNIRKRLEFGRSWFYPILAALEGTKRSFKFSSKEINFLLLSVKQFIIVSFVTITSPVITSIENYDSNPIGLIIVILVGLWAVTSSFLDGLFICLEENMNKGSFQNSSVNILYDYFKVLEVTWSSATTIVLGCIINLRLS